MSGIWRRVSLVAVIVMTFSAVGPLPASAATTCRTRSIDLMTFQAWDASRSTLLFQAKYSLSAVACWNGTTSWAYSSAQPTYSNQNYPNNGMTLLGKGSYLMSDGKTTDFWANFQKIIQCTTFPFQNVPVKWFPRIKVNATGKATYNASSTSGVCHYTWGSVNRIYEN